MADKGFTIAPKLAKLGLGLNTPPFATASGQMTSAEVHLTQKIAKHIVHIERWITKIKTYRILSNRIPTSLLKNINHIWTICSHLTLFQDIFLKDKPLA